MLWFQNVCLINLRHSLTMVVQLIRLKAHPRSILRPPRTLELHDRSLSLAIWPPSRCSTNLLFSSNHVKFYVIKTQHSSKYVESQKLGYIFWLCRSRPFYPFGRVTTFSRPLIEFVLEFLVVQLLSFTTFSSSVCFDYDHFLDYFVLQYVSLSVLRWCLLWISIPTSDSWLALLWYISKHCPWSWIPSFLYFSLLIHSRRVFIISLRFPQLFLGCPPQGLHNRLHISSLEWSLSRLLAFILP